MNVTVQHRLPTMTTEAFLAWPGDGSGRKFHLVDGKVRAMSPASSTHGLLQLNIGRYVLNAIDAAGLDLSAVTEGAIVPSLRPGKNVRVPDIVVTGAPDQQGQVAIPDVCLIIEILSPGNEAQTRENIRSYASVPSVQEIAVMHSQRVLVEVQRRGLDGACTLDTVGPNGELVLSTVSLRCPVFSLYRRTWLDTNR